MSSENPVVHFEMPYDNADRMAAFYEKAFGWQMQHFGEDMGNYVVAQTTETENGRPKKPGAINGGFFRVAGFDDSMELAKSLVREVGLGLAPGAAFGPEGEGWLRWCHETSPAAIRDGLGRLERFLSR